MTSQSLPTSSSSTARPAAGTSSRAGRLAILAALMIVGAIMRFSYLDRPSMWLDEAATYGRVCGTFRQMVRTLRYVAFAPLHYVIQWSIGRVVPLTPTAMRMYPAICGVLMIPAMYALTARLVDRRTALRVAALTTVSALLFHHSRDAKMYMPFWLLVAVHLALLLKWIDEGGMGTWIAWMVSGALMLMMHSPGLMIVALEPAAMALSEPRTRRRWGAFVLGLALLIAPIAGYYLAFNQYAKTVEDSGWKVSGLTWVASAIAGQSGANLVLNEQCDLLIGWSWTHHGLVPRALTIAGISVLCALGAALAIGLVPWRANGQADEPAWRKRRAAVLIAIWIATPFYVFYCITATKPASPLGIVVIAGVLVWWWLAMRPDLRPAANERSRLLGVVGIVVGVCLATWIVCRVHPMKPIWSSRYFGFVWPAVAMAACALIGRVPWRPAREGVFILFLAANLAHCVAQVFSASQPPRDLVARDIVRSQDPANGMRAFVDPFCRDVHASNDGNLVNGVRYYLVTMAGIKTTPNEFHDKPVEQWFKLYPDTDPTSVAANVAASPGLKTIVIWDVLPPDSEESPSKLDELLGSGWKRQSCQFIPVCSGMIWDRVQNYRRVCYVRAITGESQN